MVRVPFDELRGRIEGVLLGLGLARGRAALSARLIAETDRDGVRTHGLARLPRFAEMVRLGRIDVHAEPEQVCAFGALERWTGHRGPGNLVAHAMTARAMELARAHGLGAVALADTTHWQRGGTYGWQAAEAGFALLAWTNTMPNLPAWGAVSPTLGNNPLVIALPRGRRNAEGASDPVAAECLVLDMAMSQFSYGALASYRQRGELLPVPGGFDEHGELTRDAAEIERSQRALPVGFWKGSGLALMLDLLAAALSGGQATHEIAPDPLAEVGVSQIFLAIDPSRVGAMEEMERTLSGALASLHAADPVIAGVAARYPGEGTLRERQKSLQLGVLVEDSTWTAFQTLEKSAF